MQDADNSEDFVRVTNYDPERKVLSVVLKSGAIVRFQGVPLARVELLQCSEDKRRFFEKYIRRLHQEVVVEVPVTLFARQSANGQA